MKKMIFINYFILMYLINGQIIHCYAAEADEEFMDQFLIDINKDEDAHFLDPNNMLPLPKVPFTTDGKDEIESMDLEGSLNPSTCKYENLLAKKCNHKLELCSAKIEHLTSQLKHEEKTNLALQKKLSSTNFTDIESFYLRILRKLWSTLEMEETESVLGSQGKAIVRRLTVAVTGANVAAFRDVFRGKKSYIQVDEFFRANIALEWESETDIFQMTHDVYQKIVHTFSNPQTLVLVFWCLLLCLGVWAVVLFVREVHREVRWGRVLAMMAILLFGISCLFHYQTMLKRARMKRRSLHEASVGDGCVAAQEEEDSSLWRRMSAVVFGGQPTCRERFDEDLLLPSPEEMISPLLVISETCTQFLLHPLKELGANLGLFCTAFYSKVSFFSMIPATLLLLSLLVVVLFFVFGYAIQLPFWMGGIRPGPAPPQGHRYSATDVRDLIRESEEKMKREQESMIREAKDMMTQISRTTLSYSRAPAPAPAFQRGFAEPVIHETAALIQTKLERLMDEKFGRSFRILSSVLDADADADEKKTGDSELRRRPHSTTKDKVDGGTGSSSLPSKSPPIPLPSRGAGPPRTPDHVACNSGLQVVSLDEAESPFVAEVKRVFEDTMAAQTEREEEEGTGRKHFVDDVQNLMIS